MMFYQVNPAALDAAVEMAVARFLCSPGRTPEEEPRDTGSECESEVQSSAEKRPGRWALGGAIAESNCRRHSSYAVHTAHFSVEMGSSPPRNLVQLRTRQEGGPLVWGCSDHAPAVGSYEHKHRSMLHRAVFSVQCSVCSVQRVQCAPSAVITPDTPVLPAWAPHRPILITSGASNPPRTHTRGPQQVLININIYRQQKLTGEDGVINTYHRTIIMPSQQALRGLFFCLVFSF